MLKNSDDSYAESQGLVPILKKKDVSASPDISNQLDYSNMKIEKKRESALPSVASKHLSVY